MKSLQAFKEPYEAVKGAMSGYSQQRNQAATPSMALADADSALLKVLESPSLALVF